MWVASVKRWQWVVVGAAVGAALWAGGRRGGDGLSGLGEGLNDPRTFEAALVTEVRGRRLLKDVWVEPATLRDGAGGEKAVHLVRGTYCRGQVDSADGLYHWRPVVFVAPVPYVARMDAAALGGLARAEGAAERWAAYRALESPTVVDFLALLRDTAGVSYTHAWWERWPLGSRVVAGVLLVGGVWPTVVNLLVFGTLRRPREGEGMDLSGVSTGSGAGERDGDAGGVEFGDERSADVEAAPGVTEAPAGPVVVLGAEPVEAVVAAPGEEKHFGAKGDDFYPTSRGAAPGGAGAPGAPRAKVSSEGQAAR